MVFIFKKLNDLTGQSNQAGNVIAGQANDSAPGSHESSFRSPSNVYNANLGENMGQVDNGLNQNLANTQKDINQSTQDYQSNLNNLDSGFKYNGKSDLQNIGDSGTFSRLSQLLTPSVEQSQLNAVQSNTKNYSPDTSGVAAASTINGLSNQLQNQYGTSAGGSRLDALLYRNSGQAGKNLNQNLNQINQFKQGQQQQLGQESNLLNQLNQGATDKANTIKSEGTNYKNELQQNSTNQAQQNQNQFNQQRQGALNQLNQSRDSFDYKTQLQDAINSAFAPQTPLLSYTKQGYLPGMGTNPTAAGENFQGYTKQGYLPGFGANPTPTQTATEQQANSPERRLISKTIANAKTPQDVSNALQQSGLSKADADAIAATAQFQQTSSVNEAGKTGSDSTTYNNSAIADLTDYTKNQLLNQFSGNINLGTLDPSQYVTAQKSFDPNSYLDPRYNQLAQLLGGNQIANVAQIPQDFSSDNIGFQGAMQNYLNPQLSMAKEAANSLFNNSTGLSDPNNPNPYFSQLSAILSNPVLGDAFIGSSANGLNLTNGGQRLQDRIQGILGNSVNPIANGIQDTIGGIFG